VGDSAGVHERIISDPKSRTHKIRARHSPRRRPGGSSGALHERRRMKGGRGQWAGERGGKVEERRQDAKAVKLGQCRKLEPRDSHGAPQQLRSCGAPPEPRDSTVRHRPSFTAFASCLRSYISPPRRPARRLSLTPTHDASSVSDALCQLSVTAVRSRCSRMFVFQRRLFAALHFFFLTSPLTRRTSYSCKMIGAIKYSADLLVFLCYVSQDAFCILSSF
jgi:hypothetical protein